MKHLRLFAVLLLSLAWGGLLPAAPTEENKGKTAEAPLPAKREPAQPSAIKVGDTYDKVVAEKGTPKGTMQMGPIQVLTYADATIKLKDKVVVAITPIKPSQPLLTPTPTPTVPLTPEQKFTAIKQTQLKAAARVTEIVNQPVPTMTPAKGMKTANFPTWFHEGATKPDFATVDIRTTQDVADYNKWDAISSSLVPNIFYPGNEVEFNSMTKFFYIDYTIPKKRLTEGEMVEINGLYREIARCEKEMRALAGGK